MNSRKNTEATVGISGYGKYHTDKNGDRYTEVTWADIKALVDTPQQLRKNDAQWLIPSTLHSRKHKEQESDGCFSLLWVDLDEQPKPLSDVASIADALRCDYEVFTSKSAKKDHQKSRLLVPLSEPLTGVEWKLAQECLNDFFEVHVSAPDRSSEGCGQLCYLPNRGDYYNSISKREGVFFKPTHHWADEFTAKRQAILVAADLAQARIEASKKKREERKANGYRSPIEAFNDLYLVEEILECAGYDRQGKMFRHPESESGSFSASVKDKRVHSLSSRDPLYTSGGGVGAHDAFSAFTVLFHQGDLDAAIKNAGDEWLMLNGEPWNVTYQRESSLKRRNDAEKKRRDEQIAENMSLQDANVINTIPNIMSVEEMLDKLVLVVDGSQIVNRDKPRHAMSLPDARNYFMPCKSLTKTSKGSGKLVLAQNFASWMADATRQTVATRTFAPSQGEFCRDPMGREAINMWSPIKRIALPDDLVSPHQHLFLEQLKYLFPDPVELDAFLDWLAHIEQRPGELPHYGWLHISKHTGTGRNWLASVLARIWCGQMAPNVDLPGLLEGGFNGQLSCKILAQVDELQEGGDNRYRTNNKMKSVMTEEKRYMKPKYGREYYEYNCSRWLAFSNHENALPLEKTDRRWRVMMNTSLPRAAGPYEQLYRALQDPLFVPAIAQVLSVRDISHFKPGERPPLNAAKQIVIEASKSELHIIADELVDNWPCDFITNEHAAIVFNERKEASLSKAMIYALDDAGAELLRNHDGKPKQIKMAGSPVKLRVLRNHERWLNASGADLALEYLAKIDCENHFCTDFRDWGCWVRREDDNREPLGRRER